MNVLVHIHDSDLTRVIAFQLESRLPVTVVSCQEFSEVLSQLLGDESFDLLVISPGPDVTKLSKLIANSQMNIPVLFINDTGENTDLLYPEIQAIESIKSAEVETKLIPLVRERFPTDKEASESEYCRVHTSLLLKVVPLSCDIFIKLNATKYVKMFQTGSNFTKEEYDRYLVRRNIQYFHVKKSESDDFLKKLSYQMDQLIAAPEINHEEALQSVAEIQDVIGQMSSTLGFNNEVQDLVKKNMQLTLKAIGSSKKLSKIIADSQLKGKNYLSQHSVLLASVACSIASQQEWSSDRTFEKLILAAFLHDIHFQKPDLAKIKTKAEVESLKEKISEEDRKLILSHPIKASDLAKSMKEIPSDVDIVVLQHHELPDGSGFPKGLTSTQISPLSAVLIVSHEIVEHMLVEQENFNLEAFLESKRSYYGMGTFKKIVQSLLAHGSHPAEKSDKKSAA